MTKLKVGPCLEFDAATFLGVCLFLLSNLEVSIPTKFLHQWWRNPSCTSWWSTTTRRASRSMSGWTEFVRTCWSVGQNATYVYVLFASQLGMNIICNFNLQCDKCICTDDMYTWSTSYELMNCVWSQFSNWSSIVFLVPRKYFKHVHTTKHGLMPLDGQDVMT